jgi:hypothetical protein
MLTVPLAKVAGLKNVVSTGRGTQIALGTTLIIDGNDANEGISGYKGDVVLGS